MKSLVCLPKELQLHKESQTIDFLGVCGVGGGRIVFV